MFPRRSRLPKNAFTRGGARRSSAHFSYVLPHPPTRGYAVVVSKKVEPSAVARHRLKRRVLAALRALPLPSALIVYPKKGARGLSARELRAELSGALPHGSSVGAWRAYQ